MFYREINCYHLLECKVFFLERSRIPRLPACLGLVTGFASRTSSLYQWLSRNSLTFRSYAISHYGWFISVTSQWETRVPPQTCLTSLSLSTTSEASLMKFPPELAVSFASVLEKHLSNVLWLLRYIWMFFTNLKNIKGEKELQHDLLLLLFSFLNTYWGEKQSTAGFLLFL